MTQSGRHSGFFSSMSFIFLARFPAGLHGAEGKGQREFKVQSLKFKVQSLKFKVQSFEFKVGCWLLAEGRGEREFKVFLII